MAIDTETVHDLADLAYDGLCNSLAFCEGLAESPKITRTALPGSYYRMKLKDGRTILLAMTEEL